TRRLRRRSSGRGGDLWPWRSSSMPGRGRGLRAESLGHGGVGEPLIALADEVALLGGEALALEQRLGDVARFGGQTLRAARLSELRQRVDQRPAYALAGEFGIDEEQVDFLAALEAGEARDTSVDHGEQRQGACQPGAESLLVIGPRGPGLALVGVVVLGRELLDAGAKNLGAPLGVGRDVGAQGDGGHRFGSQVVVPSLLSLMATPRAASWSRNRSDSAQFRAARAAARSATIASIFTASMRASI